MIVKKHGGFQRKGSTDRVANANDLRHKCGKPRHFMRDCQSRSRKLKISNLEKGTKSQTMLKERLMIKS